MLPDEEEGFTVRDRRGQRAESEGARPSEADPLPGPERLLSSGRAAQSGVGRSDLPPEPDLAALFLLLANSAVVHLGGSEALDREAPADPAQAKFSIDLLRLLREKTEGNRSPDESRLLDGILYDLEMRFVRAMGGR